MALELREGTVEKMIMEELNALSDEIVLQVVLFKQMDKKNPNEPEKYVANISDGKFYVRARLSPMASALITQKQIGLNSLIQVKNYKSFEKSNNKFLYIVEISKYENRPEQIGAPVNYNSATSQSINTNAVMQEEPQVKKVQREESKVDEEITLISGINPFLKKFSIVVICLSAGGSDSYFTGEFFDRTSKIRIFAFSPNSSRFNNLFEPGNEYRISNGTIRIKRRSSMADNNKKEEHPSSEFEIILDQTSDVKFLRNRSEQLFKSITQLKDVSVGDGISLLVYVLSVGETTEIMTKQQKKLKKRDLLVCDFSTENFANEPMRLTMWGTIADKEVKKNTVYLFTSIRANIFNDAMSLNMSNNSAIIENPETERTAEIYSLSKNSNIKVTDPSSRSSKRPLKEYFQLKSLVEHQPHSMSFAEEKTEEVKDSLPVFGYISYVKPTIHFYSACPDCRRKLQTDDLSITELECLNCNKPVQAELKGIMNIGISDYTSMLYATCFTEVVELLFDMSIKEIHESVLEEPQKFNCLIKKLYTMKIKAFIKRRQETYNGEMTDKYSILSCEKVDNKSYVQDILEILK